jgi:hypothetical protein
MKPVPAAAFLPAARAVIRDSLGADVQGLPFFDRGPWVHREAEALATALAEVTNARLDTLKFDLRVKATR